MHERRFDPSRAHWLDDPERRKWLPPEEVIAALHLREGEAVADIGAGTGYFTLPMAAAVGPRGHVFALDVAPEMLAHLQNKLAGASNVECVEAEASSTGLPAASCNLVFMANVWHEFDDRAAVLVEARRVLKPGGRIAILDWRPDVEPDHGPPLAHRIAQDTAKTTLQAAGFLVHSASYMGSYSWLLAGSSDDVGV